MHKVEEGWGGGGEIKIRFLAKNETEKKKKRIICYTEQIWEGIERGGGEGEGDHNRVFDPKKWKKK